MRKVTSILAVVVFSIGLLSCEPESTADTDTLYELDANGNNGQSDDR